MADQVLAGKKIAVLVESQYIAHEIRTYQDRFSGYGARVDVMSRLWGNPVITFVSEVEEAGRTPQTLEVGIDFAEVAAADYAAIIMAANYTSVRLRWVEPPAGQPMSAAMARTAPAVEFFRQAMQDKRIVKAAPCHGLWLLTPVPEVLAGRKVTCNPVVLSDVINTGAEFVPPPAGGDWARHVVVDDDLITSTSAHSVEIVELFVDAIKDRILAMSAAAEGRPAAQPATSGPIV